MERFSCKKENTELFIKSIEEKAKSRHVSVTGIAYHSKYYFTDAQSKFLIHRLIQGKSLIYKILIFSNSLLLLSISTIINKIT